MSVNLALANGTATGGGTDYGAGGAGNLQVSTNGGGSWSDATSATFAAGSTSMLVRTPIVNDTRDENAETFTLTATRTAGPTTNASAAGTATINDTDPPALAGIEGTALAYTENAAATPISGTITVSNVDKPTLASAAVQITGNYASGQDVLAFTNQLGITGNWNAGTGVLTLTGTTTVANYQTALRSVTYVNTSDSPSTATRTVSFGINDGALNSTATTRDINVTAVNDAPTLGNGTLAAVAEDTVSPAGQTVSAIFSGQFADIDTGSSFGGIAVVGNSANAGTQGSWQYSTNGGANWYAIGTVADGATALAVSSSTPDSLPAGGQLQRCATRAHRAWPGQQLRGRLLEHGGQRDARHRQHHDQWRHHGDCRGDREPVDCDHRGQRRAAR